MSTKIPLSYVVRFGEHKYLARTVTGEERMNAPFRIECRFLLGKGDNIDPDDVVSKDATIDLERGAVERTITGIVSDVWINATSSGVPELVVVIETHDDQTILTNGSYYAHNRIYDVLHVTDRDDYHVDELTSLMTTSEGERPIPTEQENAELIAPEFVEAVRDGREPFVPGWSVLPTMRVLHRVQEQWDAKHGKQLIPGRPVT